ncbi:MAG: hypothetical protein K8L99_04885 [Anaerolineae bacterium]|nr:hypothetical protein [Anaerolineae bacterium]
MTNYDGSSLIYPVTANMILAARQRFSSQLDRLRRMAYEMDHETYWAQRVAIENEYRDACMKADQVYEKWLKKRQAGLCERLP